MSRIKYLLIAMLFIISASFAQSITNYSFTATSGTFTPLSGGTTVPTLLADGAAATVPIGFDFWYMGVKYTSAVAVSDGFLSFNPSATTSLTNNLATCSATYRPLVAPLWDDLDGRATGGSQASYLTTGTPGSRVFTFEWLNWEWNYNSANPVISFQAKLYEGTGVVQFVYQDESGAVSSGSASIGITAVATGAGNYLSLDGSGASPIAMSTAESTRINIEPATGQTYTFTPPAGPSTPTGLVFSGITRYAMTLEWVDVAGEAGYKIYRSIDGITYTLANSNTANDTDYAASGLTPGITYYWQVYANAEIAGSPLTGSQITNPPVIPAPPINIAFSNITTGSMDVSWQDNSTDEKGFRVWRSLDGLSYSLVKDTLAGVGDTTATGKIYTLAQTGLALGQLYYFRVSSYDDSISAYLADTCRTLWGTVFGTKWIILGYAGVNPDTYPSFTAAINALNVGLVGPGGVTFLSDGGQTFVENVPTLTATGTASAPILFQKKPGTKASLLIRPAVVGTKTTATIAYDGDAVIRIAGGDYITFDGVDVADVLGASTDAQRYEYGYLTVKASVTDACKYVTIKNATITMNKATAFSAGICVSNTDNAPTPVNNITVTSDGGRSEYIYIYSNVISNVYHGIVTRGHSTYADRYIEVGDAGANSISNFGGLAATTYGFYAIYGASFKVNNNMFNGGAASTGAVRAIYTSSGVTGASIDINNNDITLQSSALTSGIYGIENVWTGTININGNVIHDFAHLTATTGGFYGISNTAASTSITINNNTIRNYTNATPTATSAAFYGIYSTSASVTLSINFNQIYSNTNNAATGAFYGIYVTSAGVTTNILSNTVRNNTGAGTGTFGAIYNSGSVTNLFINSNGIYENTKTGASGIMYCVYASTSIIQFTGNIIWGNTIPTTSGTSAASIYGYYNFGSPTVENLYNNNIYNLSIGGASTSTSCLINGIYTNTTGTAVKGIYGNIIYGLSSHIGTVAGIRSATGTTVNIFKNKVYNLSCGAIAGTTDGLNLSTTTTTNVYNNFIYDLRAPACTLDNGVRGINYIGSTAGNVLNAYYNSVYLNAMGAGGRFGSSAISITSINPTINLIDNILMNTSGAYGLGKTVAFRYLAVGLANYAATSNNNDFFAPVVFYDGTTAYPGLVAYQALVAPRDNASISADPKFLSYADAINLHIDPNYLVVNRKGKPTVITDDIDTEGRHPTTPDIGADEYTPTVVPGAVTLTSPTPWQQLVPQFGQFTWTTNTDSADHYTVMLSTANPPTTEYGYTKNQYLPYSGLTVATKYFWQVKAWNDTTDAGPVSSGVDSFMTVTPPNSPSNLVLSNITGSAMDLEWDDNSTDEDSFFVYKSTDNISYLRETQFGANETLYSAGSLNLNTCYYWRVTAWNSNGESQFASANNYTLATTPGQVSFVTDSTFQTKMRFVLATPVNPPATQFAVKVSYAKTDKYVHTAGVLVDTAVWATYAQWGGANGFRVTKLACNVAYLFEVKARNGDLVATAFGSSNSNTTSAPRTIPYTESFTGTTFPPTQNWDNNSYGTGARKWARSTTYYNSTPASAYIYYETSTGDRPNNDWLITPVIGPVETSDSLVFWYRSYSTSYLDTCLVRISTNPNRADTSAYALLAFLEYQSATWARAAYDLSAYNGQNISVAFHYPDGYGYFYIDDVTVKSAKDAQAFAIIRPDSLEYKGVAFNAQCSVKNNGLNTTNIPVVGEVYKVVPGAPLNEGFEGTTFPPTGWTVYNVDGGDAWVRYTTYPRTGTACASIYYDSPNNNDWLVTPQLFVQATDTFGFWYRVGGTSTTWRESLQVRISTAGNTVPDFTILVDDFVFSNTTYLEKKYSLSAYAGQMVYIAVVCKTADQWRTNIDDVTGPAKVEPTVVWADTTTVLSVGTGATALATFDPYTPDTRAFHSFKATTILTGDANPANDAVSKAFRVTGYPSLTLVSPANGASPVPLVSQLVWNKDDADFFDVYLEAGVTPPTVKVASLTTDTVFNYTLPAATQHYWMVVAWNDTSATDAALADTSEIRNFTTGTPPNAPTGLELSGITTNSMNLDWTDNASNEEQFNIYVSTDGVSYTFVDTTTVDDTSYTAGDLDANIHYYWRVASVKAPLLESDFTTADNYTLAETPGKPTFSNVEYVTMKVYLTPLTNPASTQFCTEVTYGTSTQYLHTAGALVDTAVWATYASFGGASGKTVTDLLAGTQYTFKTKARNGASVETGYGAADSATTKTAISAIPYFQNFEAKAVEPEWVSGINSGTANDWVLGTPAKTQITAAYSGVKCWVTGLTGYTATSEDAYVITPAFDFSGLNCGPTLSFWHNFYTEANYDACIVEYTTDGLYWTKVGGSMIGQSGVTETKWYNNTSTSGPIGPPKWSGRTGGTTPIWPDHVNGWVKSSRALNMLAGEPYVQFRFRYGADASSSYEGWAFDDFRLDLTSDVSISTINVPTSMYTKRDIFTPEVEVSNNGDVVAETIPVVAEIWKYATGFDENKGLNLDKPYQAVKSIPISLKTELISEDNSKPISSGASDVVVGDTLYYDGAIRWAIGGGGGTYYAGVRFTAPAPCSVKAAIFRKNNTYANNGYVYLHAGGTSLTPGAIIESVPWSGSATAWLNVSFAAQHRFDYGNDFWIVVSVNHLAAEYPLTVDAGPSVYPYRSFISGNGVDWINMRDYGLDNNWNIRASGKFATGAMVYTATDTVFGLGFGKATTFVDFPAWTADPEGNYAFKAYTAMTSDAIYLNNSMAKEFTVEVQPMTLTSPGNGTFINDSTPTFEWTAVDSATSYKLEISDGTKYLLDTIVDGLTCTLEDAQYLSDGTYYWKVRVETPGTPDPYTDPYTLTIDKVGPAAPVLTSPAEGDTTNNQVPSFSWEPVVDAEIYNIVVYDDITKTEWINDVTDVSGYASTTVRLTDGTYHWYVRCQDAAENWGAFTDPAVTFVVDTIAPDVPVLTSPSGIVSTRKPTFLWESVTDARQYNLKVTDWTKTIVVDETLDVNTYTPLDNMAIGGPYSWTVNSHDGFGNWSDIATPPLSFTIQINTPGWVQLESIVTPQPPKMIKEGGALVAVPGEGKEASKLYAFVGTKTNRVRKYEVGTGWSEADSLIFGHKYKITTQVIDTVKFYKKFPGKGAAMCYDGVSKIYATKGNGTCEFFAYDLTTDAGWTAKAFVPTLKGLKGGTSIQWYNGKVYLLAGGQKKDNPNNFWVYDPLGDTVGGTPWTALGGIPLGPDIKIWKDGSSIVELDGTIYAIHGGAKTNLFYAYDWGTNTWLSKEPMPIDDSSYHRYKKKLLVKDGAASASSDGAIYATKGGGTEVFWRYIPNAIPPDTGYWDRLDRMPIEKIDKKHAPKTGAAMASLDGSIYFLVGNKQVDFWCFTPMSKGITRVNRPTTIVPSTIDKVTTTHNFNFDVTPNPFNKLTTIRYTVPMSGKVAIRLYNATGRLIETLVNDNLNAGTYSMKLSANTLAKGVYFIKYASDTNNSEIKLIVQ